jgi:AcrR family transcriptional regulator
MTMPRLAAYLNVGVTSIYRCFKSERDLLDAMTEEALVSCCESMPPLRSQGWEEMLGEFFVSFYALLAADTVKCDLIAGRIGDQAGEGALDSWARAGQLLTALADAGFPPSLARHAFFTLSSYTQGFLLVDRTGRVSEMISSPSAGPAAEAELPGDAGPQPGGTAVLGDFEFGITNIIAGLRQLLPGVCRRPAPPDRCGGPRHGGAGPREPAGAQMLKRSAPSMRMTSPLR